MSDYERIKTVIHYLEKAYSKQPSLNQLAQQVHLSPYHFHRLFSRWAGITPKSFVQFLTANHAKNLLQESKRDLLDVSFEVGLSGPGRLHDLLVSVEAMSPGELKSQGAGIEITYGFQQTPFGLCLIALTARGICHLEFTDSISHANKTNLLRALMAQWPHAHFKKDVSMTALTIENLFNFSKKRNPISVILSGSPFQIKVWEALMKIPPGKILSYKKVAHTLGHPKASRAVGSAIAHNSVAFLVPCHRVIHESGAFGKYRWGSSRKKAILAWESGLTPPHQIQIEPTDQS